ncbi:MAG: type II secretion system F family protein [Candidatus Nanopelagicales bacterium]
MNETVGALLGLGVALGAIWVFLGIRSDGAGKKRRASRVSVLIDRSGVPRLTPSALIASCLGVGSLAALLTLVITAVPAVAAIAFVVAGYFPIGITKRRGTRRSRMLREGWPDAVDTLGSAVKSGMSLPEAVADLADRGPALLRPAFAEFRRDYRATGSFPQALETLERQLRDSVADRVIASLRIAREVGGSDLGRVLATLSDFVRQDARTRGEVEARQSWTVNAARVAVAAPWIMLLLLCTRAEAVAAYSTPVGGLIIVACAALSVVAYRIMLAIGRLPDDQRIAVDRLPADNREREVL